MRRHSQSAHIVDAGGEAPMPGDMPQSQDRRIIVVGALIACLLLLAFGGVAVFLFFGTYTSINGVGTTGEEISHLTMAVQSFRVKYRIYPPSKIKLCSNATDYDPGQQLDRDSLADINHMWPNIGAFKEIPWDGALLPAAGVVLEGDQCLVFFLGGIPGDAGPQGFASNRKNPAAPGGARMPVFYEFNPRRLVQRHGNRFPSYLDAFERSQPYAYFSAGNRKNGYNPRGTSDCATLGVWPYAASLGPPVRYVNQDTFQIISAGRDGQFGPGTELPAGKTWTPETADAIDPASRDDLSNFYDAPLGMRQR